MSIFMLCLEGIITAFGYLFGFVALLVSIGMLFWCAAVLLVLPFCIIANIFGSSRFDRYLYALFPRYKKPF